MLVVRRTRAGVRGLGAVQLQSASRCAGERTERSGAPGTGIFTTHTHARTHTHTHTRQQDHSPPSDQEGADGDGAVRAAGGPGPAPQRNVAVLCIYRLCKISFPRHGDDALLAAAGGTSRPHLPAR